MDASNTVVTLLIGGVGVAAAALADSLGVPTIWSSLVGLAVVVALIGARRWWRERSRDRQ